MCLQEYLSNEVTTKTCEVCGRTLPTSQFNWLQCKRLSNVCRDCETADMHDDCDATMQDDYEELRRSYAEVKSNIANIFSNLHTQLDLLHSMFESLIPDEADTQRRCDPEVNIKPNMAKCVCCNRDTNIDIMYDESICPECMSNYEVVKSYHSSDTDVDFEALAHNQYLNACLDYFQQCNKDGGSAAVFPEIPIMLALRRLIKGIAV